MRLKKGFSILELLIVLVIVGILGAIAVYTIGVSRATSRDAKRVSDISVLRSGLSQYWLQKAVYPTSEPIALGKIGGAVGLTSNGFVDADGGGTPILTQLPLGPKTNEYYIYHGSSKGYSLKFTTEKDTAYGKSGVYYAHAGGVDQEDVEK